MKVQGTAKRGKQDAASVSHKKIQPSTYQATRLEGKVQNLGIKNLGRQKRKPAQSD